MKPAHGEGDQFKRSQFLQNLFNAVPALLFIVDCDVSVINLNSSALNTLGGNRKALLLKRAGDLFHCIHSFESSDGCGSSAHCRSCVIRKAVEKAFEGNSTHREITEMILRDDSGTRNVFFKVTASPFHYRSRKFALLVMEDVTEKKQAEKLLHMSHEILAERVRERTAELFRINEELETEIAGHVRTREELEKYRDRLEEMVLQRTAELEAANRALAASYRDMESFSYSASHDLREPLVVIDWFSNKLFKQYGNLLDGSGKEMIATIRETTVRMQKLIDDLLSFARMSTQGMTRSEVDMKALAHAVSDSMKLALTERDVLIEIRDMPAATGDLSMLRQVLTNLLSNALKYTREKKKALIEIGGFERTGEHCYYVKDNGVGFSSEQADRLFGFFRRLHPGKNFEGTGIGLVIAKKVVEKHGGRVWAEGKVNKGATFYFSLPSPDR